MERHFFSLAKRKRLQPIRYVSPDRLVYVNVREHGSGPPLFGGPGRPRGRAQMQGRASIRACAPRIFARDAKHVPGRKTDVSDAQWLQRLHEYGLLRASFRPQAEIAGLRAYLRQRERLLDLRSVAHPAHAKGTDADEPAIAAWPTAKHFTSWLALAPHNKISGGRVLSSRTTARKIAVLFYNTLQFGMAYTDPGATYYEDGYRQRVLHNLQRRAKSLGFGLQPLEPDATQVGVS